MISSVASASRSRSSCAFFRELLRERLDLPAGRFLGEAVSFLEERVAFFFVERRFAISWFSVYG